MMCTARDGRWALLKRQITRVGTEMKRVAEPFEHGTGDYVLDVETC